MKFNKTTEAESKYQDLDKMELNEILKNINKEDILVPVAVEKAIPQNTLFCYLRKHANFTRIHILNLSKNR